MAKASRRLLSVITAHCLLIIGSMGTVAYAATLSLLVDPLTLDPITAGDILRQGGAEREISLGSATGTIGPSGTVSGISITPPGLLSTTFNRDVSNLWRLAFADEEFFGPVTVEVNYTVIDNSGMTGFLNSVFTPASRIAVTGALRQLRQRRRVNGSLRDLTGSAVFALDIRQAVSSGAHSGTLIVEVNFM